MPAPSGTTAYCVGTIDPATGAFIPLLNPVDGSTISGESVQTTDNPGGNLLSVTKSGTLYYFIWNNGNVSLGVNEIFVFTVSIP